MADSALQPVAEALFGRLNVASLKAGYPTGAGATGGVTENPVISGTNTFPFVWYEIRGRDLSGLGQGGDVTEIELRIHVFSTAPSWLEARRIMREAIRLLKYQTPTIAGYQMPTIGRPSDEIPLPFEELNGVKVRELVTIWTLFAAEVAA